MDFRSNYDWRFQEGFLESYIKEGLPKDSQMVNLPHPGVFTSKSYFDPTCYQRVFCYEKEFDLSSKEDEVLLLKMEGALHKTKVFLNGSFVQEAITSYFPTEFDLTPFIKSGKNRLLLVVDSKEDKNIPPFGGVVDYLTFGGLYRPLSLLVKKKNHIENVFFTGKKDGTYQIKVSTKGEGKLHFSLWEGKNVLQEFEENSGRLQNIDPWDIQKPCLYTLKVSLVANEKIQDEKEMKIGFRDVEWKKDGFYLNGTKRKLLGLNRHQNYPFIGASAPKSLQALDADILKKEIGVDVVRTSHYPQSEDFLSRCDEIGLLVLDEVPGWQYIGKEETWRKNFLSFIERMVKKERNHPSLIAYGVRVDESEDDHSLYKDANEIAHALDPTRKTLGVRNFKTSELLEDIYAYNDFSGGSLCHGLDSPMSIKRGKAPLLISEYAGHMYPTKSFDNPLRRKEQALRHFKILDDFYKYKDIAMAIGWCAFDYNTHKEFGSGDGICYHGVNDIYRNPKEASFVYKSQKDEEPILEILGSFLTGDNDEALMRPLYLASNCDFVSLYANNTFIGSFYPNKKDYPHLPHAPILINDWIGESFEEKMPKWCQKKTISLLNKIASKGVAHLKVGDYLRYSSLFLFGGLDVDKITKLYYKYVTSWGKEAKTYRLDGYKDGKKVIEKKFGLSTKWHLEASFSKEKLRDEETYDAIVVRILAKDENGNRLPYFDKIASLSLSDSLEALSPTTLGFVGGSLAFFIRIKEGCETKKGLLQIQVENESIKKEIEIVPHHLL